MVAPGKLPRGFDADDVVRLLLHANHVRIAVGVGAVKTQLALADVVAHTTQPQLVLHIEDGLHQVFRILALGPQYVKCNALRRLLTDPRQSFEFRDEPRERLGKIRHGKEANSLPDSSRS